ncbi:serine/threonine kinase [Streptomyces sp. SA15]|uniref:DUF6777 domain-containing protein n=1 Tax=Streptomyces sp. SA15 TaxID=934019 RepID=UPI000BAFDD17|nr:DUF6777 domain-containing protein [Streptomyces sp. SA15]PAZ14702.1 serine/threonine kinase [Streptomyces sp. SA15]
MRHTRGIGRAAIVMAAILSIVSLTTTACLPAKIVVKAIARGAPAAAPFFAEALGLGTNLSIDGAPALGGGVHNGDRPGLYGGSRDRKTCDKDRLAAFLTDRTNRKKAAQWAEVQDIGIDQIGGFLQKLTPVLLRNDTLVKNHDYKKGKAVAFDALLEAGIAVLVNLNGKPVVQCSCGNPLGAFEHDVDSPEVEFKGKNKKWKSYDREKVVKVEPTDDGDEVEKYELVDVQEEDAGLERPVGSDGTEDTPLPVDPGVEEDSGHVDVPEVTGTSVEEARQILESRGLAVETTEEPSETAGPGMVLGQSPAAGERVPAGGMVTLTVAAAPFTSTSEPTSEPPVDGSTAPGTTPTATDDGTSGAAVPEGGSPTATADLGGADSDGSFDSTS